MVMARDVEDPSGGSQGRMSDCLAILTARRTAPHCLSEPLLSKRIIRFRRNLTICVEILRNPAHLFVQQLLALARPLSLAP